jgi:glycosyltransferase involved in cell wall biosynthesis
MRVLFLHQNFPGQFVHIAQALVIRAGVQAVAIMDAENARPDLIPTIRYTFDARSAGRSHPLGANFSARVARAEIVARGMLDLRDKGFAPDLVIGHIGWGETLFVRDVFPDTKLLVYAEYYYAGSGADVGFDPEFSNDDPRRRFAVRGKNAALLSALTDADFGAAPTRWQGSRFPKELQKKIAILHEGIDTDHIAPNAAACFRREEPPLTFTQGDEVITFVNRNLEPYRGYHVFMRALPAILAARPNARVVIVGGDGVSYGAAPPEGQSWKQIFLEEVRAALPMERVHFVGKIPHADLLSLLQISSAHVYLTYPFVLSWSMLEAMSAGAPVIASRTSPVQEVIEHVMNGILVDFFDTKGLSEAVIDVLANPARYAAMREAARGTIVQKYDLRRVCLPKWMSFIDTVTKPNTA